MTASGWQIRQSLLYLALCYFLRVGVWDSPWYLSDLSPLQSLYKYLSLCSQDPYQKYCLTCLIFSHCFCAYLVLQFVINIFYYNYIILAFLTLCHGCSNHLNLEMEAEFLTKTLSYLQKYWLFWFHSDNWLILTIFLQRLAIFNIYNIFTPFVKLCGCRFLYFFSLCDVRNKAVFLLLEHSSLRGVKQKNHIKNVKFWPLNPYYKRSDQKT